MKFTEKVSNLVNLTLSSYSSINEKKAEAEKLYEMSSITGDVYAKKMQALRQSHDEIYHDALRQIETAKTAYVNSVMQGTELSGDMIGSDAALLTTPGLTLTPYQFSALVDKHLENPAMTQLLKDYSNRHEGMYADFIPGADEKISGFCGFCDAAINCPATRLHCPQQCFSMGSIPRIIAAKARRSNEYVALDSCFAS